MERPVVLPVQVIISRIQQIILVINAILPVMNVQLIQILPALPAPLIITNRKISVLVNAVKATF